MTAADLADTREGSWVKCLHCGDITFARKLTRMLSVCPGCGHHQRLTAVDRISQLLDPGSATPIQVPRCDPDPLGFADALPYVERLRRARDATGLSEAVICVRATIRDQPIVAAVMDFRFMGGSLGCDVGARIAAAAAHALRDRTPLLLVTASGGARMQEGILSLMQMAKTSAALAELDEAGVLTVALITDPTYGGVAASYATLADVIIAEPGARLGFAGPRVIEQTIRQRLPAGFQTAEFLLAHGLVDDVRPRIAHRHVIGQLASAGRGPGRASWRRTQPSRDTRCLITSADLLPESDAWAAVRMARHIGRPTTLDHANNILNDFIELRGDRLSGDCTAIAGGIGWLEGEPVMLIGHQKGHDAAELLVRNFGMPVPAGYRKAARLMRLAAKLGIGVLTLVDTPGAYPGTDAEERGQAFAIAENLRLMSALPVPIVAVVTGEGGSGGALGLAVADRVLCFSNAVYSVISPEGCAAILWRDPAAAPAAAASLKLGARDLLERSVVDAVIPEPGGGAHTDPALMSANLKQAAIHMFSELFKLDSSELVSRRRKRFYGFGSQSR